MLPPYCKHFRLSLKRQGLPCRFVPIDSVEIATAPLGLRNDNYKVEIATAPLGLRNDDYKVEIATGLKPLAMTNYMPSQ